MPLCRLPIPAAESRLLRLHSAVSIERCPPRPRRQQWPQRRSNVSSSLDFLSDSEFEFADARLIIEYGTEILLAHFGARPLRLEHRKQGRGALLISREGDRTGFIGLIQQLVAERLNLIAG